jgi:feruloyl esterase
MNATPAQLDHFARFFRISGMGHCRGGPGAWMIGQSTQPGIPFESQTNALAAIVDWVENGKAPDTLQGTKLVNDSLTAGIQFQRKHCRFVTPSVVKDMPLY